MIPVHCQVTTLNRAIDGYEAYQTLSQKFNDRELFLLESLSGPDVDREKSLLGIHPVFTIKIYDLRVVLLGEPAMCDAVLQALNARDDLIESIKGHEFTLRGHSALWDLLREIENCFDVTYADNAPPLQFGFFGYFGYDTIRYCEKVPHNIELGPSYPDIQLSIYQQIICCDLKDNKAYLIHATIDHCLGVSAADTEQLLQAVSEPVEGKLLPAPELNSVKDSITKAEFLKQVDTALHHVAIGDIYQIQVGHELTIDSSIQPFEVYQRLRQLNPSPYMYYVTLDDLTIVGASPELYLSIYDDEMTMRPIAGTIRRGKTPEEDAQQKQILLSDEKERAEHLMLVDLCRNDISRVCEPGTLEVPDLMIIETYSHVLHIVSTVIGHKQNAVDKWDVMAATFPAGTMTGTPKIRAVEIIESLETSRRGLYAGCIGFFDFSGATETALVIRTAMYVDGKYHIRASAGIVADSKPESEWMESISKLSSTYLAITGKELRHEHFIN